MVPSFHPELHPATSGQRHRSRTFRSLLVVDDDERYRQALIAFLEFYRNANEGWFQHVYEAHSSEQCMEVAIAKRPDLVLLDLEFLNGEKSGLDIFAKLKTLAYPGKVAIVSGHSHPNTIFQAMKLGVCGYLLKDQLASQLPNALVAWSKNQVYLGADVTTRFFDAFQKKETSRPTLPEALTARESEVLQLLVEGASNQTIAKQLYVTTATVKAHLTSIFNKLHVSSRTQAIVKAVKLGLVTIAEFEPAL